MRNNILKRFWLWLKWGSYTYIKRVQFNLSVREILKTPSVQSSNDNCTILSMISHRDIWMYMLSIKSFKHFFKNGKVVVLNDGTLTDNDIYILKDHIKGVEIIHISSITNKHCPKGGCWERLLCVADKLKDSYVIVLDADMVTQSDVNEVQDCLLRNYSFIMGLQQNQIIKSMKEVMEEEIKINGKKNSDDLCHIQELFDTNMDKINGYNDLKYLKGSGGFNGFAKGSFSREDVEKFSQMAKTIFGERWTEWGTEQIAVCFLIANSLHSIILPHPKYSIYYPHFKIQYENSSILHFVGMSRFKNDMYINCAKRILKTLV